MTPTIEAKGQLEQAGYTFQKNPCGIGWQCVDKADGSVVGTHNELGKLIWLVAEKLGI